MINLPEQEYNKEDYQFKTTLNRIQSQNQIPNLFDNPPYSLGGTHEGHHKNKQEYFGRINKREVMIRFEQEKPCRLFTKTEPDLKNVKNVILEKLINPSV